ncbi:MAG: metallophosphoesterase family protein [Coriobacteriia bacterium]
MRRIALFSDVHANLVALDAVLNDIAAAGMTEMYCLGDLVGYGPDPSGVVDRIRSLGIPTIKGNYDEGIGDRRGECGCYYATEHAKADGAASYAFTDAALDEDDHEWLASLPGELRLGHGGARILLAHGSPRKINEYLLLDRQDSQLARLADGAEADVVCVGHIHIPYHRNLTADDGRVVHYVSSGSAGKPKDGDPRASWVELVLGTGFEVSGTCPDDLAAGPVGAPIGERVWLGAIVHRTEYDVESVAVAMLAAGLPVTLAEALKRG